MKSKQIAVSWRAILAAAVFGVMSPGWADDASDDLQAGIEAFNRGDLPGAHVKNLFLRNKKGRMWLVTADADRQIDLKRLAESLGAGRLGFEAREQLRVGGQALGIVLAVMLAEAVEVILEGTAHVPVAPDP